MKQDCYFRLSICGTILISLMLIFLVSGCTVTIPIGENARLGYIDASVQYRYPDVIAEQPNIGGWHK
jgi:hypothetical protein